MYMSWKKIGGIDYSGKNQNVRNQNANISLASVIGSFGEVGTKTNVKSDLFLDPSAHFFSYNNSLDNTGLILHYPMYDLSNGIISSVTDNSFNISLTSLPSSNSSSDPSVINNSDPTFNQYLQFDGTTGNTKSLISNNIFNLSSYKNNNKTNHSHSNALTMSIWMKPHKTLNTSQAEFSDVKGFLLFALENDTMDGATNDALLDPSIYLWAPGYKLPGPQLFVGAQKASINQKSTNAIHNNGQDGSEVLVFNEWNFVTLVIKGRFISVFINGKKMISIDNFSGRIPNKKIIINGNEFNDNGDWTNGDNSFENDIRGHTSQMKVDLVDFKVYNYALDDYYIQEFYDHDLPFFQQKTDFLIDSNNALFGTKIVSQNTLDVFGESHFFNGIASHNSSLFYDNLFIHGKLSLGHEKPEEKVDVLGNIKASGDLYLGSLDTSSNGIFFQGVHGDVSYNSTSIEERIFNDVSNSELLVFKGFDVSNNIHIGDRIRFRAPNIYFDTFNSSTDTKHHENLKMIFNQEGNLGINELFPTEKLVVNGKMLLNNGNTNSIFINNNNASDPRNKAIETIAIGSNIFKNPLTIDVSSNIVIGNNSLSNIDNNLSTCNNNLIFGHNSLFDLTGSNSNIVIGNDAFKTYSSNYGSNISLGNNSGFHHPPDDINDNGDSNNIYNSSNSNIYIGHESGYKYTNLDSACTNSVAIGNKSVIGTSDAIILGDYTNKDIVVGIGKYAPNNAHSLDISGTLNIDGGLILNGAAMNAAGGVTTMDNVDIEADILVGGKILFANPNRKAEIKDTDGGDMKNDNNNLAYDFVIENRNIKFMADRTSALLNTRITDNGNANIISPNFLFDANSIQFEYVGSGDNSTFKVGRDGTNAMDVEFFDDFLVKGNSKFEKRVIVDGSFNVSDDASFNSHVDISGNTDIHSDLHVHNHVGISTTPKTDYVLDISGDTRIVGNFTLDGSFNFNDIISQTIDVQETHNVLQYSEQIIVENTGGYPAFKVTQNGMEDVSGAIAEFHDGDLGNDSLVFKIGNNGVSELHGQLGINKSPPFTNLVFDLSGNSNFYGNISHQGMLDLSGSMLFGDLTIRNPTCSLDFTTLDGIKIPAGTGNDRPSAPLKGTIRYNTDGNILEVYGVNDQFQEQWLSISSGGGVTSANGAQRINLNSLENDATIPNIVKNSITMIALSTERFTLDSEGNIAVSKGRSAADPNSNVTGALYVPNARFEIQSKEGDPSFNMMQFTHFEDPSMNVTINERIVDVSGIALDFKTNYYNGTRYVYQDALTMLPNGHIGIGTPDPSANLEISNIHSEDLSGNCLVNILSNPKDVSQLRLFDNRDVSGAFIEYDGATNFMNMGLVRDSNFHNYLTLKPTGNNANDFLFGIGNNDPKRKLQINTPLNDGDYVYDNSGSIHIHHPDDISGNFKTMLYFTSDNVDGNTHSLANFRIGSDDDTKTMLDIGLFDSDDTGNTGNNNDDSNNPGLLDASGNRGNVPSILRLYSDGKMGLNMHHKPNDDTAFHIDGGHLQIGHNVNTELGIVFTNDNKVTFNDITSKIIPSKTDDLYNLTTSVNDNQILQLRSDDPSGNEPRQKYAHFSCNVGIGETDHATTINTPSSALEIAGTCVIGKSYIGTDTSDNSLLVEGKIGIGTTDPKRSLDLSTSGQITFGQYVIGNNTSEPGIYWNESSDGVELYGIYRTSGDWIDEDYQQLMIRFATGIILHPGDALYNKSHVGVVGGMAIGSSYYTTNSKDSTWTDGMIIEGNVGIGTTSPSAKLDVYKDFTGVLDGNYAARIYGTDSASDGSTIGETGIRICQKGGGSLINNSTKALDVYSNGTSKMVVTGAGNVGIGTTSPGHKLDVNGNVKVSGNLYMETWIQSTTGDIKLQPSSATNNVIVNQGNVGIGTTSPLTKLQIGNIGYIRNDDNNTYGTNDAVSIVVPKNSNNVTLNDPQDALILARPGTANQAWQQQAHFRISRYEDNANNARTRLDFALLHGTGGNDNQSGSNPVNIMTLLSSGNVGIGTSSPIAKLDVNGSIHLSGGISQNGADLNIDNSSRRNGALGDRRRALVHNIGDQLFINYANDYTGNTTIDSPCHVNGQLSAGATTINHDSANVYINDTRNYSIYVGKKPNTDILHRTASQKIDKDFNIYCGSIDTNGGTIDTGTGNITCGKLISNTSIISAGGTNYDLANDFVTSGGLDVKLGNDINTVALQVTGITKSSSFQATSDINLKTNIEPIHNALNAIQHIKGVHYNFKSNLDQKHTGLIAQDVEEILPHAVSKDDNGVRSLDYNSVIGLLVECVKDLKKENNEKTNIINKLSEDNRRISEDNRRISNDISNIKKFLNIN